MKSLFITFAFILFILQQCRGSNSDLDIGEILGGLLDKTYLRAQKDRNVSEKCSKILSHLANATDMLDASSKLQSGIFYGNLQNLGHYDQCMDVSHKTEDGILQGQYCTVAIAVNFSAITQTMEQMHKDQIFRKMTRDIIMQNRAGVIPGLEFKMALCIPDLCKLEEITSSLNALITENNVPISVTDGKCITNERRGFSAADIAAITTFSIFGILLVLSTIYDLLIDPSKKRPLLAAFSVYSNGNRLLTIQRPSKSVDEISCVHGIRALSIFWVVLGHRFGAVLTSPTINGNYIFTKWIRSKYSTYLTGATVSVDTFFVLSGMLLAFIFLKQIQKSGKFNPFLFYLHRFLRLTPALAAIVFFEATLFIFMSNGPLWEANAGALKETCEKSWWETLLYIQNYHNPDGVCVGQSWYLAVDMQLFVLSPLILLPLWKWPKKTLGLIVVLIFASVAIIAAISYTNEYPAGMIDPRDPLGQNMKYIYLPTHTRYGTWLVGILLGYFLHITKDVRFTMNKWVVAFTWVLVLTTALAVVLVAYPFYKLDGSSTLAENVAFLSLHRLAWAICIAWIVFACKNGYGGPINWFLSWGFWQPISRLSYALYLIHMELQMILSASTRTNTNFSDKDVFVGFASDIVFGLGVAMLWSLAFESPILIIEKLLLGKGERKELPAERNAEGGFVNPGYKVDESETNS